MRKLEVNSRDPDRMEVVEEGGEPVIYIVKDNVRIAKRGAPDTPQARTWVSIEPGWHVYDNGDMTEIVIEQDGVRLQ